MSREQIGGPVFLWSGARSWKPARYDARTECPLFSQDVVVIVGVGSAERPAHATKLRGGTGKRSDTFVFSRGIDAGRASDTWPACRLRTVGEVASRLRQAARQ